MERKKKADKPVEEVEEVIQDLKTVEEVKETGNDQEEVEEVKSKGMERTKKAETPATVPDPNEGKVFYKKVGGGSARIGRRIIKPGEKVWLFPDEIHAGVRDMFIPLSATPQKKEEAIVVNITESKYSLKQRGENSPWWDIVDSLGKHVNDKALSKVKAEEFIKDMMR